MALTTIQALYDEARSALESGKDERAIGLGEHLLESFPHYLEAHRILGEAHLNRKELDQAAAAFERVLRADPENIPVHVGLAVTYERQGNLAAAIREFEQAFEIKPDLPELRNQVVRLYTEAWGSENAHLRLKKTGLARLYMRGSRFDKAIQEFQDVLAQEPDRRDVQVALAEAYWRNGQEEDAADLGRAILADDPEVLKANLILGFVLLASGKPQGRELWRHAQQLDPSQGVAYTLFDGMMPPVEPMDTSLPAFDEDVWRAAKADKARRAQEELARAEAAQAALREPVAQPVAAGSWLDEIESAPAPALPKRSASFDDDFLKSLVLGGDFAPAPASTATEVIEDDFSIDDLGLDITPFSLDDIDSAPTPLRSAPAAVVPPPAPPPVSYQVDPQEATTAPLGVSDAEFDMSDEGNYDLPSDLKPFSFDDWDSDSLDDIPGMGGSDTLPDQLQPFSLESFEEAEAAVKAPPPADDDLTLPTSIRPFSLDELSLDSIDSSPNASPFGRDLPIYPDADPEPTGFSWQEPRSRSRSIFNTTQEEPSTSDEPSIFNKLVTKKQTQSLTPLTPPDPSELDDEAMSFFSHDDVDLRDDSEIAADLLAANALAASAEPETGIGDDLDLTPFSLTDLGLDSDEIAALNQTDQSDDDGFGFTPFSLTDLGLDPDEIAALAAADAPPAPPPPPVVEKEPDLTPFSLSELGLSDEEIAAYNQSEEQQSAPTSDEPEMTPFSLTDLGLDDSEIAAYNQADQPSAEVEDIYGEAGLTPFSLTDLGLDPDQMAGYEPPTNQGNYEEPVDQADTENQQVLDTLFALGQQQGFVDLTDIINHFDDPESHAEEIDRLALDLHHNGIQIRDGDEIIDMDELAEEVEAEYQAEPTDAYAAPASDEPDMTPFSLADLGLSDEEIAALSAGDEEALPIGQAEQPSARQAPGEEPELIPFSFADLGMSDEEIAAFSAGDEQPAVPSISDEPEMTPFSLADLGLDEDEIAAFNATEEPQPAPAVSDEPEMTPFSLADLGLDEDEIAAFNATEEPQPAPAVSDEPEMTPFSLADLGLDEDEIAAFNATEEPQPAPAVSDEPEMTPFSLADLGLDEDEIAAFNATDAQQPAVSDEPEMTPFSLADLGLDEDEIAAFNATDAQQPAPAVSDEPEMTPFSLADLGLDEDEIAAFNATDAQQPAVSDEPEMTPFSLADLGLDEDEIAAFNAGDEQQPAPAVSDEPEMTPFSLADLGLDEDEIAAFNATDAQQPAPAVSDEPEMTPFSLTDLGLSDEEIAALNASDEPQPAPAVSDEPDMTPFSLADLGLSDEEIAALNATDEPQPAPAVSDEPEMTPFSLTDLGLSDEEIAALNAGDEQQPASIEQPDEYDEPDMSPFSLADFGLEESEMAALRAEESAAASQIEEIEPDLTPFSLADLGLSDEEIASIYTGADDDRNLRLSDEELEGLDLALPMHERGPVRQDTQEAVNEVIAAEPHAEPPVSDEPDMTPFSFADLGLTEEEIAALDTGTPAVEAQSPVSDEPDMTPFSFADLGLTEEEIAALDTGTPAVEAQSPIVQPPTEKPAKPAPPVETPPVAAETVSPARPDRPLYSVSPRPADRPLYPVSPRPAPRPETEPVVAETPTPQQPQQPPSSGAAATPVGDLPDLSAYQDQLSADPANHGLRLALARMMSQTDQVDQALNEYKRLIKQGELLAPIAEDIQDLIETNQDAGLLQRLHRALGDAYSKQGRWREAMEEYSWVLAKPGR